MTLSSWFEPRMSVSVQPLFYRSCLFVLLRKSHRKAFVLKLRVWQGKPVKSPEHETSWNHLFCVLRCWFSHSSSFRTSFHFCSDGEAFLKNFWRKKISQSNFLKGPNFCWWPPQMAAKHKCASFHLTIGYKENLKKGQHSTMAGTLSSGPRCPGFDSHHFQINFR